MLKKAYLEAWIPLDGWDGNAFAFEDMSNKVCDYSRFARSLFRPVLSAFLSRMRVTQRR